MNLLNFLLSFKLILKKKHLNLVLFIVSIYIILSAFKNEKMKESNISPNVVIQNVGPLIMSRENSGLNLPILSHKKVKYIIYQCREFCGGWGDRMRGILSVYALSLLLNREFRILMNYPCPITDLLQSNDIKWDSTIEEKDKMSNFEINTIDDRNKFSQNISILDPDTFLNNYEIITIANNVDWTYSMTGNKLLKEKIKNLGFNTQKFRLKNLIFEWYHKLFRLKPSLQEKYDQFLTKVKSQNNTKLLCVQIRTGGIRSNHKRDKLFNSYESTKKFWKFINKNFLNDSKIDNFKLFITTDNELVERDAIQIYGIDKVILNDGPIFHIDRDVHRSNDCKNSVRTILDFHCLKNCDIGVISSSNFGRFGLWNRKNPTENLFIL